MGATSCFEGSGIENIVINNVSGYMATEADVSSFGELMLKVINLHKDVRLSMGKEGREHIVKNYSKNALKMKWAKIYTSDEA